MFKQVNNRGPETGRSYSIGILGQRDERRRRGRRKHPRYVTLALDLKAGGETSRSISQTLASPLTLLRRWVLPPICAPFPVLLVPPLPSSPPPSQPRVLLRTRACEHLFVFLCIFCASSYGLSCFRPPSSPSPLPLSLSLSHSLSHFPSLSCHGVGLWHVWETSVGPQASDRTLIYWECWVTGLFLELVNMRTSFPKVYLYPRGLLTTRSRGKNAVGAFSVLSKDSSCLCVWIKGMRN